MEKRPLRVGAIIETTEGVLLVQDAKDKQKDYYISKLEKKERKSSGRKKKTVNPGLLMAKEIMKDGRFSLPGGKIESKDYEEAKATQLIGVEKFNNDQIELFKEVIKNAIAREIDEELGIGVDQNMVKTIMEIQGRTRDHIICLVHAEGRIKLNREELSGIGLLNEHPQIPLNEFFYQSHVRTIYQKYLLSEYRPELIKRYLSKLNIKKDLIMDVLKDQVLARAYLKSKGNDRNKNRAIPHLLQSSPNFVIYDDQETAISPHEPRSFTKAENARIVPPSERPKPIESVLKPKEDVIPYQLADNLIESQSEILKKKG